MIPYYDHGGITIYHGDAREVVPSLSRSDLVVLDPPFDQWNEVERIDARTVVAFTSWQHRASVHALYGNKPRAELIWHFEQVGRWVSHDLPRITHEAILVFGETSSAYVGEEVDDRRVRRNGKRTSIGQDDLGPRFYAPHAQKALKSVLNFPRLPSPEYGIWAKPLGLMVMLLEWISPATILDPFMGSGTTLRAAKDLGRRAIGVEVEERYCEIAVRRLGQEVLAA